MRKMGRAASVVIMMVLRVYVAPTMKCGVDEARSGVDSRSMISSDIAAADPDVPMSFIVLRNRQYVFYKMVISRVI
jgi:hypothetical protein